MAEIINIQDFMIVISIYIYLESEIAKKRVEMRRGQK